MELRSSAGADFAVFGRSTVLTDSGILARRTRRSGQCSRCFECRIAVSTCFYRICAWNAFTRIRPRPRDRTPERSNMSPSLQKNLKLFALFGDWLIHPLIRPFAVVVIPDLLVCSFIFLARLILFA